ncbi:hypothetical protein FACS18948_1650 [Clostridia bacterium]|nr:hypothetical protein FACS18948_1650 [Clostridia bacterium]
MPGQSWTLSATGKRVVRWDVSFAGDTYQIESNELKLNLKMPRETAGSASLEVTALLASGKVELFNQTVSIGSARDALISEWIALIRMDEGTRRKSGTTTSPGQCKRYLVNTFALASAQYALPVAETVPLSMPDQPNPKDDVRIHGSAWLMPELTEGNPFEMVAAYDFSRHLTDRENRKAAREFLTGVLPGDVIQMMAVYSNGERGTHTLLITEAYDPETDRLYWADSNFRIEKIDGVKYGVVDAHQSRTAEEIAGWLTNPSCAATIYRIREDIVARNAIYSEILTASADVD